MESTLKDRTCFSCGDPLNTKNELRTNVCTSCNDKVTLNILSTKEADGLS